MGKEAVGTKVSRQQRLMGRKGGERASLERMVNKGEEGKEAEVRSLVAPREREEEKGREGRWCGGAGMGMVGVETGRT